MSLVAGHPHAARAQYAVGPLSVRGGASFSAEGYTVDGLSRRRAPASLLAQANAGFEAFGLTSGFDLTYSTDQSALRQSVNRLAFDTRWAWGQASLGDVSPTLSAYSLRGTVVRGGAVELTPRDFVVHLVAGRSQRSTRPDDPQAIGQELAYRQFTYGAKVGYGAERQTHLHLTGVYVRDVASSLPEAARTVETQLGESEALTPQENFSLTPDVGLRLWDGRIGVRTQVTASAITRNLNSPFADAGALPGYMTLFIDERRSSRIDYAGEAELDVRYEPVALQAAYERVEPGFEALGIPQIRSDQERLSLRPSVGLLNRRVQVGATVATARNNLRGQRLATYRRRQLGLNTQARATERLAISATYTLLRTENDPSDEVENPLEVQQQLLLQTATLTPSYTIQPSGGLSHVITATGSLQRTDDQSDAVSQDLRPAFSTTNASTTLSYSVTTGGGLTAGLSGNYVWSDASNTTTTIRGLTLSSGYGMLDGDLQLSASAGWSQNEVTTEQAAQASLALLAPSLDADLRRLDVPADAARQTTAGWYDRRGLSEAAQQSDYAWYLSGVMHGTALNAADGVYSSDVEWAFRRGVYDAVMLQQLADTFASLSTQWTASVGASYTIGASDVVRLNVRGLTSSADAGGDFREVQATLRYQHRF